MTKLILTLLFGLALQPAMAQEKMQSRGQCMAKCLDMSDPIPEEAEKHEEKLKAIRAMRNDATDPMVLKRLDQDETHEMDRYLGKQEKLCRHICRSFPETLN